MKGIWLCLSGGGFRAALFQLGCLKRLHELGLLRRVAGVSATSGGALTAALLSLRLGRQYGITDGELAWQEFERQLLAAAVNGIVLPAILVWCAYLAYWLVATLTISFVLMDVYTAPYIIWAVMLVGFMSHVGAFFDLFMRGALRFDRSMLWGAMASPQAARVAAMHYTLYEGSALGELSSFPVYLSAADLITGREIVFSRKVAAELSKEGCEVLWRQIADEAVPVLQYALIVEFGGPAFFPTSFRVGDVPIARAVAASSAYPPFFSAVPVSGADGLVGTFVDGGVVDNHATNVARAIARHVWKLPMAYGASFADSVDRILAIDASAPLVVRHRWRWSRAATLWRLPDLLHGKQQDNVMRDVLDTAELLDIKGSAVGLRVGD